MRRYLAFLGCFVVGFGVRAVTSPAQTRHPEPAGPDLSRPVLVRTSPADEGTVYVPFSYKTEGQREFVVGPPPENESAVCFIWFDNGRTLVKATRQTDSSFTVARP